MPRGPYLEKNLLTIAVRRAVGGSWYTRPEALDIALASHRASRGAPLAQQWMYEEELLPPEELQSFSTLAKLVAGHVELRRGTQ